MTNIRIQHDKNRPYVVLNKECLANPKLSWAAKGLWSYLLSLPDDWHVSVNHLKTIYKDHGGGRDAIRQYLKELEEEGYCEKIQKKNSDGTFCEIEYVIHELKKSLPRTELPAPESPAPVDHPLLNNESLLSKDKQQQQELSAAALSCESRLKTAMEIAKDTEVPLNRSQLEKIVQKHSKQDFIQACLLYRKRFVKTGKQPQQSCMAWFRACIKNQYWIE